MKTTSQIVRARRRVAALCLASLVLVTPGRLAAQFFDDFNDGNDAGWTRYDPVGQVSGNPRASYVVTNGGYRIKALIPPDPRLGPSRCGSVREDFLLTNFYVSVDVVVWDDTIRQAFGILARVNTPGFTNTSGYAFTYERGSGVTPTSGDTDISRITGEAPTGFNGSPSAFHLAAGEKYRFVFLGVGSSMEGRIYLLPNTRTPVLTITGSDAFYASGWVGLVVYDNNGTSNPRIMPDVTFDNFYASDIEPPTLTFERTPFDDFVIHWPQAYSEFILQGTPSLSPPIVWTDLSPVFHVGNHFEYSDTSSMGNRFFRLIRP